MNVTMHNLKVGPDRRAGREYLAARPAVAPYLFEVACFIR